MNNYLVIDTETTGLDPAEHRAVEVSAVTVTARGQITCAFTTFLNPGRAIPAVANMRLQGALREIRWQTKDCTGALLQSVHATATEALNR